MSFLRKLFNRQETKNPQETNNAIQPSAEDLEKAKKIFFEYSCDYSFMRYEGVFDEYQQYHVSKEQESAWRTEYIAHWVSQLSVEDLTALYHLLSLQAFEALPELFSLAEKGDSFAKLTIADVIWELKDNEGIEPTLKTQSEDIALQLWNSLTNKNDVWISEAHKAEIPEEGLKNLHASTPEEYVVNGAKRKLAQSRKSRK